MWYIFVCNASFNRLIAQIEEVISFYLTCWHEDSTHNYHIIHIRIAVWKTDSYSVDSRKTIKQKISGSVKLMSNSLFIQGRENPSSGFLFSRVSIIKMYPVYICSVLGGCVVCMCVWQLPIGGLRFGYLNGISSHCAWRGDVCVGSSCAVGCCRRRLAGPEAAGYQLRPEQAMANVGNQCLYITA